MKTVGLPEALKLGLEWQHQSGAAIVHVVRAGAQEGIDPASKLVVNREGRVAGEMPAGLHTAAVSAAREALAKRRSRLYSLTPSARGGEIVGMQGGLVDIFVEVLPPVVSLVVAGAGHIAQPLAVLGKLLGFHVTVIDDRPEFANRERFPDADDVKVVEFVEGLRRTRITRDACIVLVTRGHAHDLASLRYVLTTEAGYIGMIGSKMRIRTVMDRLREEGFEDRDLDRVYAPVGIDIGSHTPQEIAVAIAAEIIDVYRGGKAPHLTIRHSRDG